MKIERHPLPLTTLGKILLEDMKYNPPRFRAAYEEAFDILCDAIRLEGNRTRIAVHPYNVILLGSQHYLEKGGSLDRNKKLNLSKIVDDVEKLFSYDVQICITAANVKYHLR